MIVTNIKIGKKNQILIYADGEYLVSMSAEVFARSKIKQGSYIDKEILDNLMHNITSYKAKEKALNILSYRSHSKKEIIDKIKRSFGENYAQETAKKLESTGLINDKEFAENYARQLIEIKKYGIKRVKLELSKKGISSEIISETIENMDIDESSNLKYIVNKKNMKNLKDKKEINRAISYLTRLGYGLNQIKSIFKLNEE